jgi:hypothetical protein
MKSLIPLAGWSFFLCVLAASCASDAQPRVLVGMVHPAFPGVPVAVPVVLGITGTGALYIVHLTRRMQAKMDRELRDTETLLANLRRRREGGRSCGR